MAWTEECLSQVRVGFSPDHLKFCVHALNGRAGSHLLLTIKVTLTYLLNRGRQGDGVWSEDSCESTRRRAEILHFKADVKAGLSNDRCKIWKRHTYRVCLLDYLHVSSIFKSADLSQHVWEALKALRKNGNFNTYNSMATEQSPSPDVKMMWFDRKLQNNCQIDLEVKLPYQLLFPSLKLQYERFGNQDSASAWCLKGLW